MIPQIANTEHITIRTTPTELRDLADHLEVMEQRKIKIRKGQSIPLEEDDMTEHLMKTTFQCGGTNIRFVLND